MAKVWKCWIKQSSTTIAVLFRVFIDYVQITSSTRIEVQIWVRISAPTSDLYVFGEASIPWSALEILEMI